MTFRSSRRRASAVLSGGDNRQELDSNLDYHNRGKLLDLELLATKYTQLATAAVRASSSAGLERLPELRLATDAVRLVGLGRLLPEDDADGSCLWATSTSRRRRPRRSAPGSTWTWGRPRKTITPPQHIGLRRLVPAGLLRRRHRPVCPERPDRPIACGSAASPR